MIRSPNTTVNGFSFAEYTKLIVWNKGRIIPNFSPVIWRWDACGNVMKWVEYGNRNSAYGWEIDHVLPVAKQGSDDFSNLQPLNWENNARKSDNFPWSC